MICNATGARFHMLMQQREISVCVRVCGKAALNVDACCCGRLGHTHTHSDMCANVKLGSAGEGEEEKEENLRLFVLHCAERLNAASRHIILSSAVRTRLQRLPHVLLLLLLLLLLLQLLLLCVLYVLVALLNGKLTT